MSDLRIDAFETPSIELGEDGSSIGQYAAGVLPHVAVPDASRFSRFHRTTGSTFKLRGKDGSLAENWSLEETEGWAVPVINQNNMQRLMKTQIARFLRVDFADGTHQSMPLYDGLLEITMTNGFETTLAMVN